MRTARGEVAVEGLAAGDEVVTASGDLRPVIWIGSRRVRPATYAHPGQIQPVRVRAGAFGENRPTRDLVLSPGHAVYVDGVLIPVGCLVNGATIVQEEVESVRYFHVELDAHDVLLAEGLPCESYLDDGNRLSFANSHEHTDLFGRLDPLSWDQACAPVVAAGPQLIEVQQRLHDQAEALGWSKGADPKLHLLADGQVIAPTIVKGQRYWFAVPAVQDLVLASHVGVLAQLLPGCPDKRRLGVAVSGLSLDGQPLDLAHAFAGGIHGLEAHGGVSWRWTDGAASLSLSLAEPTMVEVSLHMAVPSWVAPAGEARMALAN